jgi:hypothetical protein
MLLIVLVSFVFVDSLQHCVVQPCTILLFTSVKFRCSSCLNTNEEHLMGQSMSVCLLRFFFATMGSEVTLLEPFVAHQWDPRFPLLEHIVA